jgi:hypothetical protein
VAFEGTDWIRVARYRRGAAVWDEPFEITRSATPVAELGGCAASLATNRHGDAQVVWLDGAAGSTRRVFSRRLD